MGRALLAVALAALLSGADAARDLDVSRMGDRVRIHARAAPVSSVLDRFAQITGAKLTYDGVRPTDPVTLRIEGATPAQAVVRILEGLAVNYVLQTDATGTNVTALTIVTGPRAATTPPRSPMSAPTDAVDHDMTMPTADVANAVESAVSGITTPPPAAPAESPATGATPTPEVTPLMPGLPATTPGEPMPGSRQLFRRAQRLEPQASTAAPEGAATPSPSPSNQD